MELENVNNAASNADELRQRVKEFIRGVQHSDSIDDSTRRETLRLMHELEALQIKLVVQNEDLRQARGYLAKNLQATRRSEEQYRRIIQLAMDGFWLTDSQGFLLDVNDTYCQMSGYNRQELLGLHISDLEAFESATDVIEHNRKIMNRGEDRFESRHRRKDGSDLEVEVSVQYQPANDGTFVAFLRDVSRRKQTDIYGDLKREVLQILNESDSVLGSIQRVLSVVKSRTGFDAVGIRLLDGEDFPYYAQQGFSDEFLLAENSLIERTDVEGVCRGKGFNASLECTCGLVISGQTDSANPLFTPGGSFWTNNSFPLLDLHPAEDPRFHPRNTCIHNGYASVALIPIRNKDKIVGLIQLNDHRFGRFSKYSVELLEGIASRIGEAIARKQALDKLQKKEADIEQFIYTTSHDLRTPLVTIKSFLVFLENDLFGGDQQRVTQDLRFLHCAADKLKMMLDELLELSRIDRIESEPTRIPFMDLLADVVDDLDETIKNNNVDILLPDTELILFGDRLRLCQIWKNLIDNAIKFSGNDSRPCIELGLRQSGEETLFFVKDLGIGIDPRYIDKIFGFFEKLNPMSPGAGLGLSIVQRIIEKYGGKIWVESEGTDKGACFMFTLPRATIQD